MLVSMIACGGGSKPVSQPQPTESPASTERPAVLSQADIQAGLKAINDRVVKCGERFKMPGVIRLKVQIDGDGRVVNVEALDEYAGTPTGGCAEEAMRHASFPVWRGPVMTVTVPYRFH